MIKTMKIKSCVAALLAAFTLGLTTSCADMFDIESNRVVYDHEINSTSDSVYTTLGVLQSLRKVADRYVILGEVRGDMAVINEYTKTSLRNLANFNFEDENEYLNVRDYYTIINNCNYALAKMDTTLAINNQRVMIDEYVALQGIRAWTYLQLVINYGEVPYYTYPIVTESDVDRAYAEGKKDVKAITEDLARQLTPYLDYDLPTFVSTMGSYPVLRLVLADLYLWSGDYENAKICLEDYFMKNKKRAPYKATEGTFSAIQQGYYSLGGNFLVVSNWKESEKKYEWKLANGQIYSSGYGDENLASIQLESSELGSLFTSGDNKHPLYPSNSWKSLCNNQLLFRYVEATSTKKEDLNIIDKTAAAVDLRMKQYWVSREASDETLTGESMFVDQYTKFSTSRLNIYRRSIGYLRWAEALNALAKQRYDAGDFANARKFSVDAFYLLKDASKVFFPEGSEVQKKFEFAKKKYEAEFKGVHSRGSGDVSYDTEHYVLEPGVIAQKLYGVNAESAASVDLTFNDTIEYIDNLIFDELALESTLEGNRFGDLIRFAKRRKDWGDTEYRDFLAKRVAERGVNEEVTTRDEVLYNKLNESEEYWYLPFK